MAIQKPYGISVTGQCYDASTPIKITWNVSGDISVAFAISIYNNSTNALTWSLAKTTSYATEYTLPINSIPNGQDYRIQITIYNSSNVSASSDFVIFTTSSTPTVTVPALSTIASPNYTFTATYAQAQSIAIKSWIAILYNSNQVKIKTSPLSNSSTLSYTVEGMSNNENYYIEFQATSLKGLTGTSGKIPFFVQFVAPNLDVDLTAENTDDAGVKLTWNVTQIIGHSDSSTFVGGEKLDVTGGKSVVFDSGYWIPDNFTMKTWIESVSNVTIGASQIILSALPPTNINALWLEDSAYTTPQVINISVNNVAPTNNKYLWWEDSNQTIEWFIPLMIDLDTPSTAFAWLESTNPKKSSSVLAMEGSDGRLELEYYNSAFHLVSYDASNVRTEVTSVSVTGTKFYVYIQQNGNTYTLGATAI